MLKRLFVLSTLAAAFALPLTAQAVEMDISAQIKEGGIPLIAIVLLSILSVTVIIERFLHLRANVVVPQGLSEQAQQLWADRDYAGVTALGESNNSTLGHVIAYLASHRQHGYAIVSSGAGDIASSELRAHQQKAYALAIVATVAPIVGLLGTVIGMIDSFRMIAYADGMGNPALLAGGISQALINTAAGLVVALPALLMHHYFKHRVAVLGLALEQKVNRLINLWFLHDAEKSPVLQAVSHAH